MKVNNILSRVLLGFISLLMLTAVHSGIPLWTFSPLTATQVAVPENSTVTIQYRVTSQTNRPHTLVMTPIPGVTQVTTGQDICGSVFVLSTKGRSCILSLQIKGSQLTQPINDGPVVCQQGLINECYRPGQFNILHISKAPALVPVITAINPAAGTQLGGTSVTLTGVNLMDTTRVTFGGIEATGLNVVNSTTVIAVTPAHPVGSVDVSITTSGGSDTLNDGFTYEGIPSLTGISPASGPQIGGTGVTLTGDNLSSTQTITFGGTPASFVHVVDSNTVTAVTPPRAVPGLVNVVLTATQGSTSLVNGFTYLATAVGQPSGGGVIACLNVGAVQQFIMTTVDNSSGIQWGGTNTVIGVSAQHNFDGAANTTAIVNTLGSSTNYAAGLCDAFSVDSQGNSPCQTGNECYSDWFLPAKEQLNCIYGNLLIASGIYWSSTEDPPNAMHPVQAWAQNFSLAGARFPISKANTYAVRCVRGIVP
ncbi:IPT/TIG domain-containing protein [Legionella quateirensis]|uniref:Protein with a bacterial immunoglobulin-like domain n=1 Tax=Legionella quateirensis TaxID=45072 RepID=A0A378KYQ8_9GAMM|nr:IPT/TIG domain-containing protein [Legionella quateirensis]KTD47739.1 protein with a bacterial immunoglobulin-like domain protein [Legionella quateirensis]STY18498.1 protein with a bacterial immunoglobulin-like domain [Legionella quateirensis]